MIPLFFAPLQGYTDDVFRRTHHQSVGGATAYYTPFLRWEHGGIRPKDERDIRAAHNEAVPVVPQLIASSVDEFRPLLEAVRAQGYQAVDFNMGCPFPLQARHGRGAGLLARTEQVRAIFEEMRLHCDLRFSVKMRLGWDDPQEAFRLIPLLHTAPLTHVTLHPRLGTQAYKGQADREAFRLFMEQCNLPLVYNGDLQSPDDILQLLEAFPGLAGVMIGRGWLARPSLGRELMEGRTWPLHERLALVLRLHERIYAHHAGHIPSETQLLQRMRPFWDYLEAEIGRKAFKKIHKAGSLRNYLAAVAAIVP